MTDTQDLISASDLTKSFPMPGGKSVTVLNAVSLAVSPGETLVLTGESGSGKSTLLHLLGALDTPDTGEIVICGQPLAKLDDAGRARLRRDQIGLVFQQFNLIPSLDVASNLAFQARLSGRFDQRWTQALTDRLGLSDLTRRFPEELSGGQAQRVAIGRALAGKPPVLLADEPTGSLDEDTADTVMDLMLELVAETRAALVMVTHSERLAARFERRLHLRQGALT